MKVAVAQLGARRHYAIPRMLHEAGMLARLYTDICAVKGWPRLISIAPQRLMPSGVKRLTGRIPAGVPRRKITAFTRFGWEYAQRRRRAKTPREVAQAHLWMGRAFCERIIAGGVTGVEAVYTFNGAGLELLEYAKQLGLSAIMEQTIAPKMMQRRLHDEEYQSFYGWERATVLRSDLIAREERERAEWAAADMILCGSQFVSDGIAECGGPVERCVVIPYGVDSSFGVPRRRDHREPLRVLTVGCVCLRKGAPYVLEAAKRLNGSAVFRMVGPIGVLPAAIQELSQHLELTGPVPRTEILKHYAWADVFLLPSICEGSATATYEAMAAGLPVICTPNTGSVVRDTVDGFVVPVREPEAICASLMRLVTDRKLLREMSDAAVTQSRDHGSLEAYSRRLIAALSAKVKTSAKLAS